MKPAPTSLLTPRLILQPHPPLNQPLFAATVLGFRVQGETAVIEAPLLQQRFDTGIFERYELPEEAGNGVGRAKLVGAYPAAVAGNSVDEAALVWARDLDARHVFAYLDGYPLGLALGV